MNQKIRYDEKGEIHFPSGDQNPSSILFGQLDEAYYNHTVAQDRYGITMFKFTPQETLTIEEEMVRTNGCTMSFCLSGGMEFSFASLRKEPLSIECNESCIIAAGTGRCVSTYEKGRRYHAMGISFDPSSLQGVSRCLECENAVNANGATAKELKRYAIAPRVKGILMEIVNCSVCGSLKDIYMEAKVLELIAVYLNEMVCQKRQGTTDISLSREDMAALSRAKDILDRTYVNPLTLLQLSRKVYLNEYKLKSGFKRCYGQTIYGYIMEKRMELAQVLLEQRRFKVSDVAGMVGYENTSHFITAFQKKYGVTPGKYAKVQ